MAFADCQDAASPRSDSGCQNDSLKSADLNQLLNPKTWPNLNFFALIQPEGDILPVRTVYGEGRVSNETNIGLNPLTSEKPIWFAGPDVVGSLLQTGKAPKILRAIRFETCGSPKRDEICKPAHSVNQSGSR